MKCPDKWRRPNLRNTKWSVGRNSSSPRVAPDCELRGCNTASQRGRLLSNQAPVVSSTNYHNYQYLLRAILITQEGIRREFGWLAIVPQCSPFIQLCPCAIIDESVYQWNYICGVTPVQWGGEILLLNSLFSLEPVFSVVSSEGGTVGACSSVFFVFSTHSAVCPINPAKRVCCCSDTGEQRPLRVELHSPDQFLFWETHYPFFEMWLVFSWF